MLYPQFKLKLNEILKATRYSKKLLKVNGPENDIYVVFGV